MTQENQSAKFLLGLDTGSSKTHALVSTCEGQVIGFGESGSGNYEVVGLEGFKKAMQRAADAALTMAGIEKERVSAMGFGISGYDWPSEQPVMVEAISSLGMECPYQFVNDVLLGLIAGSEKGWGVAVDAGTGNNVRGRDATGRIGRITGNSVYCGEIGGGGEMVWLAQIAVTHAWTGRGPKTRLTPMLMAFCKAETEFALIEGLATDRFQLPASLAKEVFRLAHEGDRVATEIITTSAQELAINVNAVIKQLDLKDQTFDLILIGGVFNAGALYLEPFLNTVRAFAPGINVISLTLPPVIGAILLAGEAAGIHPHQIRPRVIESFNILHAKISHI